MNKPTNTSLTAKLTISILDAVRNFLTRQTARITTRLPTIVIIIINEQTIRTTTKCALLRGLSSGEFVGSTVNFSASSSVENVGNVMDVVGGSRRRGVLSVVDELLTKIVEDDGIRCC